MPEMARMRTSSREAGRPEIRKLNSFEKSVDKIIWVCIMRTSLRAEATLFNNLSSQVICVGTCSAKASTKDQLRLAIVELLNGRALQNSKNQTFMGETVRKDTCIKILN